MVIFHSYASLPEGTIVSNCIQLEYDGKHVEYYMECVHFFLLHMHVITCYYIYLLGVYYVNVHSMFV
jgi:hypothetical protein